MCLKIILVNCLFVIQTNRTGRYDDCRDRSWLAIIGFIRSVVSVSRRELGGAPVLPWLRSTLCRPATAFSVPAHTAEESGVPSTTPQAVDAGLTRAAIFLVVTVNSGSGSEATVRGLCADLASLVRGIGFRALEAGLSCVMGIGSDAWDRLFGTPKPKESITPSPRRATSCSTSAPDAWTCVLRWRRRSWRA